MNEQNAAHNIIIENRKNINLSGVKEVLEFTDDTINAITELGLITIRGENLKIGNFNTEKGDLSASGNIIAVVYSSSQKNGGFFSKLFR